MHTPGEQIEQFVQNIEGMRTLALAEMEKFAAECALSRREAEIVALELGVLPLRYLRNCGTIGLDGQLALLRSCAAVIGLGGLGGYIVEGLARMGVGRLVLVDGDTFCDHNLNRQALSDESRLGQSKTLVAAERVRRINASIETIVYAGQATQENLSHILSDVNVVMDALDRLPTRLMLQDAAAQANVPMVHGAIAGWMGQVMTIFPGDRGLHALYDDGLVPEQGVEAQQGCPAASPMMIAAWQVHEAVKVLLNKGNLLRNRILFIDAEIGEARTLELG